jgi:hypothetical protein
MWAGHRQRIVVSISTFVVWIAGALSIYTGNPTIVSPCALLPVIPALLFADSLAPSWPMWGKSVLSVMPLALLYWLWSFPNFQVPKVLPKRTIALFVLSVFLSALFFWDSWDSGVHYQGYKFLVAMSVLNGAVSLLLGMLLFPILKVPSQGGTLIFTTLLFCWLYWGAFPWLGELI